jgi:hypothetical protein
MPCRSGVDSCQSLEACAMRKTGLKRTKHRILPSMRMAMNIAAGSVSVNPNPTKHSIKQMERKIMGTNGR